ncbi:MAG TPA: hypothetical protein VNT54_00100, partial [Solirubrobacteraceae bacterium]|nr:hypothetical protein [Solirubrobacteraceae bacterium]
SHPVPPPALLLMTATIKPAAGVPALARTDPAARLEDYTRALAFYLGLRTSVIDRIVFAENSASDLTALETLAQERRDGKDVELLSFDDHDFPVQHGRGVGEVRLMQTALSRSRLLRALGEDELFWKVTGRLRIRNLERLAATAPQDADLYADFRRHPRPWVDTRIFACTPRAFRQLLWSRVDGMRHDELAGAGYSAPEEWLFGELLPERVNVRLVPRLRVEPMIEGYSGFGDDYARPSRRLWSAVRGTSRRILPRLWI